MLRLLFAAWSWLCSLWFKWKIPPPAELEMVTVTAPLVITPHESFKVLAVADGDHTITLPAPRVRMKRDTTIMVYQLGPKPVRIVAPQHVRIELCLGDLPQTAGQYAMVILQRKNRKRWKLSGACARV